MDSKTYKLFCKKCGKDYIGNSRSILYDDNYNELSIKTVRLDCDICKTEQLFVKRKVILRGYSDITTTMEYHDREKRKYDAHPFREIINISQTILLILIISAFAFGVIYNFTLIQLLAIIGGLSLYFLFMLIMGYYTRHGDDRKKHILHKILSKDND